MDRPSRLDRRLSGRPPMRLILGPGFVLLIALMFTATLGSARAECIVESQGGSCSDEYTLLGSMVPLEGSSVQGGDGSTVRSFFLPSSGRLTHADMLVLEADAHAGLTASKAFRLTISPHNEKPNFDTLVAQFDYASGFDRNVPGESKTIQQRIDEADIALRQARNAYAFLAVYGDQARLRNDIGCPAGSTRNGEDDRCNFPARMRESVREGAYLRMIFGQQFTVDALETPFSGGTLGGEAVVLDEIKMFEMAVGQYDTALNIVQEGLHTALGSGCYISDFYTETEWALFSRALDGKERALHHIAVRKSYMPGFTEDDSLNDYRTASINQHINLIGLNGLSSRSPEERCTVTETGGVDPDNLILAEMVTRMVDTRIAFQTLQEGRNIYGYDVSFTPARPYRTSFGSNDTGLLNEAKEAANRALQLQQDQALTEREFDRKQERLTDSIQSLFNGRDEKIQAQIGCDRSDPGLGSDEAYFACVTQAIAQAQSCDPTTDNQAAFDACEVQVPVSDLRQSLLEQRAIYLQIRRVEKEMANIQKRADAEEIRNVKVSTAIWDNGAIQATSSLVEAMLESLNTEVGTTGASVEWNPAAPIIAIARSGAVLAQAFSEVSIEDAESENVIRNLLLDLSQLIIEQEIAVQEYNAKQNEFDGIVGQTQHDVLEAQRERAYLQNSPANDPSFRLVRDSARLNFATQMVYASRVAYLAARRAEYEYAARLNANGIDFSELYRARNADDLLAFLAKLEAATNNLIVADAELNQEDFTLSVSLHLLGLTDEYLGLTGVAAEAERIRRFRIWVAENTVAGTDGKPVLRFSFTTSLTNNGIFSQVIQQGFNRFWLFQVAGIGQPKAGNTGMSMNLRTTEQTLSYRRVAVTQAGVTHLRTRAGCIFNYKLIAPAALVGGEWPADQPAEAATTDFKSAVNGANGEATAAFLGRPVSASNWEVEIFAGTPEVGLPDMDLQQLNDIELFFSTTRGSRVDTGEPRPEECIRGDF